MSSKNLPIEMFNYIMSFIPPSPVLKIIKSLHTEWENEIKIEKNYAKRNNQKYKPQSFYKNYFNSMKKLKIKRDEIIKNDDFEFKMLSNIPNDIIVKWRYLVKLEKNLPEQKLKQMNIDNYNKRYKQNVDWFHDKFYKSYFKI